MISAIWGKRMSVSPVFYFPLKPTPALPKGKPTPALPKGGRRKKRMGHYLQTTPAPPLKKEGMRLPSRM